MCPVVRFRVVMALFPYILAAKSAKAPYAPHAALFWLNVGEDGQPSRMELNTALDRVPVHMRDGGHKIVPAHSVLVELCEKHPRKVFGIVMKT